MKNNTKIYNRFKGFTLEDCDCRYCLYYGGRRKGKVTCLSDECVCADEIRQAKKRKPAGAQMPTCLKSCAASTR